MPKKYAGSDEQANYDRAKENIFVGWVSLISAWPGKLVPD